MILVTGGAGYIGSVLVKFLIEKGYAVRVFDKLYFGDTGLKQISDRIEIVQGDIRTFNESVLTGITAVIHLAALSNDPMAEFNPKANNEINTIGTKILADACKKKKIKKFIFASSCSVYDLGFYAEDYIRTEKSEVFPKAAYSVSKHEAEKTLLGMTDDNFCPVILRKGTVYGFSPRMRYDLVVNTMIKDAFISGIIKVYCGGEMWRPLVDVVDAARAYICCLEAEEKKVKGEIFNIVDKNYRILELAHRIKEALTGIKDVQIQADYSNFNARSYRVSGTKIETVLGFKTTSPLRESVLNMVTQINNYKYTDYLNPQYYNIQWLELLDKMEKTIKRIGTIL